MRLATAAFALLVAATPVNAEPRKLDIRVELDVSAPPAGVVVIHNGGAGEVGLWRTGNSWGDGALAFEIVAGGHTTRIAPRLHDYTFNFPVRATLSPGSDLRIAFNLGDASAWRPAWSAEIAPPTRAQLIAVYQIAPTPESAEYRVWTGTLRSAPVAISFK